MSIGSPIAFHPCIRCFGSCAYGDSCKFARFPASECLPCLKLAVEGTVKHSQFHTCGKSPAEIQDAIEQTMALQGMPGPHNMGQMPSMMLTVPPAAAGAPSQGYDVSSSTSPPPPPPSEMSHLSQPPMLAPLPPGPAPPLPGSAPVGMMPSPMGAIPISVGAPPPGMIAITVGVPGYTGMPFGAAQAPIMVSTTMAGMPGLTAAGGLGGKNIDHIIRHIQAKQAELQAQQQQQTLDGIVDEDHLKSVIKTHAKNKKKKEARKRAKKRMRDGGEAGAGGSDDDDDDGDRSPPPTSSSHPAPVGQWPMQGYGYPYETAPPPPPPPPADPVFVLPPDAPPAPPLPDGIPNSLRNSLLEEWVKLCKTQPSTSASETAGKSGAS